MKKISIPILLSLLLLYTAYGGYREYSLIKDGNKLSNSGRYEEADELYNEVIEGYNSEEGVKNKAINLYKGKKYKEVVEIPSEERFIRGNSYVYAADRMQDDKQKMGYYEKALEEYRKAMKSLEDINIKKNYEIVVKKLQDEKQNQEQKKEEEQQGKQQDRQQGKNERDKSDRGSNAKGDEEDQPDESKDSEKGEKQQESRGEEDNNKENSSSGADPLKGSGEESREETQKKEAYTILQRLEGNEDHAFKNNERLKHIGGDRDDTSW